MKKTMFTAATVFALVMGTAISMAGPLGDHGNRGNANDVRSSVSQAFNQQSAKMTGHGVDLSSKQDLGKKNLISTQQTGTYGSSWNSQLPNVFAFDITDGDQYTLVIGKASDSNLPNQYSWMYGR